MRLVPRSSRRRQRNEMAARIAISQAEIDADLEYRGGGRQLGAARTPPARGRR
jgi:hypothetical protein